MTPVSAEMARYWRDTIAYLHQAFAEPHPPMASPLLRASLVEFAAAAHLAVFAAVYRETYGQYPRHTLRT